MIQANGQYTYTLNNAQANVQALASGQLVTDSFNYTMSDGQTYTQTTTQVQQNLISQSEAFDSSAWTRFADAGASPTVTANLDPGPFGGASTADEVAFSVPVSGIYTTTGVSGQYTFSVYVRLISGSGVFSFNYWNATTGANNLQTATATANWQRLSWTFTGSGNANSNVALMLTSAQASGGVLEFWGAQLNAGATPLTYVPTTGSPINTTTTVTGPAVIGSTLNVSVTGSGPIASSPPVAAPDTATVVEDSSLTATGNLLTNDTDPAGLPLTVTSVNGVAISGTTTIVGQFTAPWWFRRTANTPIRSRIPRRMCGRLRPDRWCRMSSATRFPMGGPILKPSARHSRI